MGSPQGFLLFVVLSARELAGLHWGAGASWTLGPSASAQTPHETAAYSVGQGAADRPVQLHMREPDSSSHSPFTTCRKECSRGSSPISGFRDYDRSAKLWLFGICSLTWNLLLSNPMLQSASVIYEYLYEHWWKESILNQDWTQNITS